MMISTGTLHVLTKEMVRYLKYSRGESFGDGLCAREIHEIVIKHAAGAAAASFAAGFLPGVGGLAALAGCVGFVWSMYYRICHKLGVTISQNKMKSLGSAVVSNIGANILGLAAGAVLATFIPGAGAIVMAMLDFAVVYVAAIIFVKMLISVFKAKGDLNVTTQPPKTKGSDL